jgi:hypothetical protein
MPERVFKINPLFESISPRFNFKNRGLEAYLVLIFVTHFCLVPLESPRSVRYCGVNGKGQNAGLSYANEVRVTSLFECQFKCKIKAFLQSVVH